MTAVNLFLEIFDSLNMLNEFQLFMGFYSAQIYWIVQTIPTVTFFNKRALLKNKLPTNNNAPGLTTILTYLRENWKKCLPEKNCCLTLISYGPDHIIAMKSSKQKKYRTKL